MLLGLVRRACAARRRGLPGGNVCGYFSTTAERPAYGCYPEMRDKDNLGHSFDFIQELAQAGSFRNAHLRVLAHDATPDAPLRTSDAFMDDVLRKAATAKRADPDTFVDGLIARAWKRKGTWEPEIRLLDAIGRTFGSFSPRSLGEIREQGARLPEVGDQLDTHAKAWKTSLGDANRANLDRFLLRKEAWAEPVSDAALRAGGAPVRELAGSFVWDLAEFTRTDDVDRGDAPRDAPRARRHGARARLQDGGPPGRPAAHAHGPRVDRRARVPLARGHARGEHTRGWATVSR